MAEVLKRRQLEGPGGGIAYCRGEWDPTDFRVPFHPHPSVPSSCPPLNLLLSRPYRSNSLSYQVAEFSREGSDVS